MEWDTNPRAKTDTHTHTQKASEISIVSLSAIILVSPFCLTMYNQWQSMYQSAIRIQLAGGHTLPWSASLSCWSWLPCRPPARTIPCQSNFAGNLEGGTVSHWEALNRDVACLLFGLLSSCWGWVLPLLLLYASLHTFRCMSCTLEAVLLRRPYFSICSSWLSFESFLLAV